MRLSALVAVAAVTVAVPVLAGPLSPNAGSFSGRGALNDHDGNRGTWQASGSLRAGNFSGSLAITLGGKSLSVVLQPGPAYLENGFCVLRGGSGRNRLELRGKCDSASFGPGTVKGYFDGDREFNGEFSGAWTWGAAAPAPAQTVAVPNAKFTCAYLERVGGVVAGDAGTRELRTSALGTLTLTPGGSYVARNGTGKYVREGNTIKLTSGPWAGARAQIAMDRSGEPGVYFELNDNRRANGSYIVDPWRTSCTRAR